MPSKSLFPPIVESSIPAFLAGNSCRLYFRLAKLNSFNDFKTAQVSVRRQDTNENVVDLEKNPAGLILDLTCYRDNKDFSLYYTYISGEYIKDVSSKSSQGWMIGQTYKIQVRLSNASEKYNPNSSTQYDWLTANSSLFSEWSTICIVKAIDNITYTIDALGIDTSDTNTKITSSTIFTYYSSTLPITGCFNENSCGNENIYSYSFLLYDDENENLLENSGDIFANQFQDNKSFNYLMKTELENGHRYKLEFRYETVNHYTGGAYKYETSDGDIVDNRYTIEASYIDINPPNCSIITVENDTEKIIQDETSLQLEEEEGRIGLKLHSTSDKIYNGNLCIRRTDAFSNFKVWTDIQIYVCKEEKINDIPLLFDYTIESGVWYVYGVQTIDKDGKRGILDTTSPVMRNFEYSYLLGQNNQQLKLMFDNDMSSFKIQQQESKVDPIGATYPVITRNAAIKYKTFPITGLISYWMDDNKLFTNKTVIYKNRDIIRLYDEYNDKNNISPQYDYIYERDFRQQVLDFLQDGEIKLFKSPTEGNVLIRLMDINYTPNQSLDRMLYSFSATAYEMADNTVENYIKYNILNPGQYATSFEVAHTKIGQIQLDFVPGESVDFIDLIYQKYDSNGRNLGGFRKTVTGIHHIKITFDSPPMGIYRSGVNTGREEDRTVGYNIKLDDMIFTINAPIDMYEFDERLIYTHSNKLNILGDSEEKIKMAAVTIDFLYDVISEPYEERPKVYDESDICIGQLWGNYSANVELNTILEWKYAYEGKEKVQQLANITSIEIEANPGVVIGIQDAGDDEGHYNHHVINETGLLSLEDITSIIRFYYLGYITPTGEIDSSVNADLLINYVCVVQKGQYKDTL